MDHIYESTNNRSFNWKELGFFEMDISLLEMNAILSSLIFNTYFHCLVLKGYKFEKETFQSKIFTKFKTYTNTKNFCHFY